MSEEFYLLDGVFGKHDTLAQPENVVRTVAQTWSEPQKVQARLNIGAAAVGEGGASSTIVGITGTKAQFDTAVTDGNFLFVGDAPTAHSHLLAAGATDVTMSAADLNTLDDGSNSILHFHDIDRARANHTGTQALSTLAQSGATSSQVATWNGTAWAPATPSSGGVAISGTPTAAKLGEWTNATTQKASVLSMFTTANLIDCLSVDSTSSGGFIGTNVTGNNATGLCLGRRDSNNPSMQTGQHAYYHVNVRADGGFFFSTPSTIYAEGIGFMCAAGTISAKTIYAQDAAATAYTPSAHFAAATLRTQSYTLAALNSAVPSPTVGQRSFITDETTGTSHAAAVGGGSLERPVYYGNGTWRIGG